LQPIILAVDDDQLVLRALERDLRNNFGNRYRVVGAGSGAEALQVLAEFRARGTQVALLLADQRMPEMTGIQFLEAARRIDPDAKTVLLTAYSDTSVAVDAINLIALDHYLTKPWDPPEEALVPVLEGLLDDWQATSVVPYEGIRVAGTLWSPYSHEVKEFLARNRVPYRWLDLETDEVVRALVDEIDVEGPLPIVFFPDGEIVAVPTKGLLASKAGLQTEAATATYDLIIVGGGPAGLAAAVNAAAEGMHTLLVEKAATGGQAGTSSRIENYLGFPSGISGRDLAERATTQALRLGTEILLTREVTAIRAGDTYRYVALDDGTELAAKAVLIATGVSIQELRAPGVAELTGAGVYYGAALTEAANYTGRPVVIVGGANSAGQAAMLFARHASKVHLVARAATLEQGMSQYLVDQIRHTDVIDVRVRTEVVAAHGDGQLESVSLLDKDRNESEETPAAAMAIFIGARPHTEFAAGVVARTGAGSILTGLDLVRNGKRPRGWTLKRYPLALETSVPGIFAAGDVRRGAQARVGAAVGSGGMAVGLIREYLKTV
jgi:thioredoxin reductase (NADPH)